MNKRRIIIIGIIMSTLLFALTFILFVSLAPRSAARQDEGTPEGRAYLAAMREDVKRRDVPIIFKAKIIDQHENPVINADVEFHLHHFDPKGEYYENIQVIHLKSDKKGIVTLNKKGSSIYIETIKCNGYEYDVNENPTNSFSYWDESSESAVAPEKYNPAIFRLRKKGDPTYLIDWESSMATTLYAGATDDVWHLDLVWPDFRPSHQTNMNVGYGSLPMYTDATVLVRSNQDHTAYNIYFAVPDASGGIMETNVMMNVAPEIGYQTNLVYSMPIISNDMYMTNVYFYIKSRGGKVYARMNANITSYGGKNDNGVLVYFHSWANPYGERNLEPETRLQYDTQQRLHDEAEAALLAGKLPLKPDISQLLKTEGTENQK